MVFGVTKFRRKLVQVDWLLGEGVAGFMPDQDKVNPGFVGVPSGVGGAQFGVPGVDGCEAMLKKEFSKEIGVRMPWPRATPLVILEVAKAYTMRSPVKACVQISPKDHHVPLRQSSHKLVAGMQQFTSMLKAGGIVLDPGMLVGIDDVNARGWKVKADM